MTTTTRAATTRQPRVQFTTDGLTGIHYAAMGLAAVTGVIHLYLYATQGFVPFLLAGLGFFGAVGLVLVLPAYRPWIYLAGVPFTVVQMGGWVAAGMPEFGLGVADKFVQVLLVASLVVLYRRDRRAGKVESSGPEAASATTD